jgi:hypothetical protein
MCCYALDLLDNTWSELAKEMVLVWLIWDGIKRRGGLLYGLEEVINSTSQPLESKLGHVFES